MRITDSNMRRWVSNDGFLETKARIHKNSKLGYNEPMAFICPQCNKPKTLVVDYFEGRMCPDCKKEKDEKERKKAPQGD